ncbi:MAG TPA: hypothetical protein VGK67_19225 [Myxococcales bacterium]
MSYIVERDGAYRVVRNGQEGLGYDTVSQVTQSRDGNRLAYMGWRSGKSFLVLDGKEGPEYEVVTGIVFSADSRHVAHYAESRGEHFLLIDGVARLLQSAASNIGFSGDAARIAFVERDGAARATALVVTDLGHDQRSVFEALGDVTVFDATGTRIAATRSAGEKVSVVELGFATPGDVSEGPAYDAVSLLGFGGEDGRACYAARRGADQVLVVGGVEWKLPEGAAPIGPIVVRPDGKAATVTVMIGHRFILHQVGASDAAVGQESDEAPEFVYGPGGRTSAFAALRGQASFVVVGGVEGPRFDRVVTPRFTPDGRLLVYRARQESRRFVVVADAVTAQTVRQSPAYDMVFPVSFTGDGKSLAYGVKDGQRLVWMVEPLPAGTPTVMPQ